MIPPSKGTQPNILIVDDTPANLDVLSSMLTKRGYKVRPAPSGSLALRAARSTPPDLILLDILMPEMDGFTVCRELKADVTTQDIPIIFISALDDALDKVKAFQAGGVDYITKPFQLEEVLARIDNHLALDRLRKEVQALSVLKDQMIRTVSHDLVVPLDVIRICVQTVADLPLIQSDGEARENLEIAIKTATQMHTLVTSLLDLSRIESGMKLNLQSLSLDTLLQEQIDNHRPPANQKLLSLIYHPTEGLTVTVDAKRMGQVVSNLLSNAIKYTLEGGTITVTSQVDRNQVIVSVKDTGLGIPKDELPRIFDKFHRVDTEAHRSVKGTGLGLSIAKAIIEQHQGYLWVESDLGEGSTFYFLLPVSPNPR